MVGGEWPRCLRLLWAVWPFESWPEMSYMLILSKCELWMAWLFLYRFVGGGRD